MHVYVIEKIELKHQCGNLPELVKKLKKWL